MHRLRFQLRHILILTALICVVCAVIGLDRKNRNLCDQLEQVCAMNAKDWDVRKLTKVLQEEYGIHVVVEKRFRKKLHDMELDRISLKNSIRILLGSADLGLIINYAGLEIVELEEPNQVQVSLLGGSGDFRRQTFCSGPRQTRLFSTGRVVRV